MGGDLQGKAARRVKRGIEEGGERGHRGEGCNGNGFDGGEEVFERKCWIGGVKGDVEEGEGMGA